MLISKRLLLFSLLLASGLVLDRGQALAGSDRIEVRGNLAFSTEEILSLIGKSGGDVGEALEKIQRAYYDEGYLFARFKLMDGSEGRSALIQIEEGDRARLGRVRFTGALSYGEEQLRRIIQAEPGRPFSPARLRDGIGELLHMYDREGFPFVQVWVDSIGMHPSLATVDLALFIMEGGRKRFEKITVRGLTKTRESVVVALSGLRVGEPYSGRSLKDAKKRLEDAGVFEEVASPEVILSPGGGGVEAVIRVRERARSSSFGAAFGYAKEERGGRRALSGSVRLRFLNIGGTLKDLHLLWNNDGAGRTMTRLSFAQALLWGRSVRLGVSLEQTGFDTLYTYQSLGLQVSAPTRTPWGDIGRLKLALNADRSIFSEGALLRSWRARFGGGLEYQIGGGGSTFSYRLTASLSYARKRQYKRFEAGRSYVSQYIIETSQRTGVIIGRSFRLQNLAVYRSLESAEELVPLSEQFYVGGAKTLRGYRENQFHGRRIALSRLELQLGASRYENGYLFADGAYVLQEQELLGGAIERKDRFYLGLGFGLRTVSRVGNIDLSFGVGERLSLRQTKVHVVLDHEF